LPLAWVSAWLSSGSFGIRFSILGIGLIFLLGRGNQFLRRRIGQIITILMLSLHMEVECLRTDKLTPTVAHYGLSHGFMLNLHMRIECLRTGKSSPTVAHYGPRHRMFRSGRHRTPRSLENERNLFNNEPLERYRPRSILSRSAENNLRPPVAQWFQMYAFVSLMVRFLILF
jgi:hypothetical protein